MNVHHHESESPGTEVSDACDQEGLPPGFLLAPPSGSPGTPPAEPPQFSSMARPCHSDAGALLDGLHLKSERQPREDYAIPPLLTGEALFRHSGWQRQRQQTWDCLQRINPMSMACYRFANCGSGAWIQLSSSGDAARCVCNCCHHRLCVPCQRAVGRIVQDNLTAHIKGKRVRFVTLTLRHSRTPLADQVSRLYTSFSALRRRKDIAPLFVGGVSILEVKVSERDGLWHAHLHILTEGSFVDKRDLSAAWHAVTGDSSIVDIRQVQDDAKTAGYICKYISKPIDASLYANSPMLDEYVTAISGRKTMATFGTWRGLKLKQRPADTTEWHSFISLIDFAARCRARDPHALRVLAILRHQQEPTAATAEPPEEPTPPS